MARSQVAKWKNPRLESDGQKCKYLRRCLTLAHCLPSLSYRIQMRTMGTSIPTLQPEQRRWPEMNAPSNSLEASEDPAVTHS